MGHGNIYRKKSRKVRGIIGGILAKKPNININILDGDANNGLASSRARRREEEDSTNIIYMKLIQTRRGKCILCRMETPSKRHAKIDVACETQVEVVVTRPIHISTALPYKAASVLTSAFPVFLEKSLCTMYLWRIVHVLYLTDERT